jgi:hypothetical protein
MLAAHLYVQQRLAHAHHCPLQPAQLAAEAHIVTVVLVDGLNKLQARSKQQMSAYTRCTAPAEVGGDAERSDQLLRLRNCFVCWRSPYF